MLLLAAVPALEFARHHEKQRAELAEEAHYTTMEAVTSFLETINEAHDTSIGVQSDDVLMRTFEILEALDKNRQKPRPGKKLPERHPSLWTLDHLNARIQFCKLLVEFEHAREAQELLEGVRERLDQ